MSTFTHKYRPPFIENDRRDFRIRHYGAPWPAEVPEGAESKRYVPSILTKCDKNLIDICRYGGTSAFLAIENQEFNFTLGLNLNAEELRELAARALDAAHDLDSNPKLNLNGDVA